MNLLLLEDDLPLGQALSRALQQAGHSLTWLRRLQDARSFFASEQPDLLLLDLSLPDGDGMDWLAELRTQGVQLPILVLTARDDLDSRLAGLREGADDYLVKPFLIPELLARMQAVSRRYSGFASTRWQLGEFELDIEARCLHRGGELVPLSPSEYNLLWELARKVGRVVNKEYLVDRLYGDAARGSDNALEVHISNLRRKLGADTIRTVRGVGYLMVKP